MFSRQEALEIYKERFAKFRNTQGIQWKMNLSTWTLIVLGIQFWSPRDVGVLTFIGSFLVILAIIWIHNSYCRWTQESLAFDKHIMDRITAELNQKDSKDSISIDIESMKNEKVVVQKKWIQVQTSISLVLGLILFFKVNFTCLF